MRPKSVLVVYWDEHDALDILKSVLEKHDIKTEYVERSKLKESHFKGRDLIISIGGDGTFLAAARHTSSAFILGINPNPERKEGHFTRADPDTIENRIEDILEDRFTVLYLSRLKVYLDDKELPLALNEAFVADRKPHHMSVYRMKVADQEELQKSSGVIIATAAGSHAWIKSAGGIEMPLMARNFQWMVRDPFKGRVIETTLTHGMCAPRERIEIESLMEDGIVTLDGAVVHDFPKGAKLEVTMSHDRLKFIDFPDE